MANGGVDTGQPHVPPSEPGELAPGYRREATLSVGGALCVDPAGRRWVLKPVPDDCRHAGGLNPAIADRLARVRDLPHARVATLVGVVRGRAPGSAHAVWVHVDGVPIDRADLSAEAFPAVAAKLAAAVDLLHARGLVHGAVTPGNVIVTAAGDVWLTHVSPYLWDDPAVDAAAVAEVLAPLAERLGVPLPPATVSMRDWAGWWATAPAADAPPADRRRWAAAVIAVAVVAVAVIAAVLWRTKVGGR